MTPILRKIRAISVSRTVRVFVDGGASIVISVMFGLSSLPDGYRFKRPEYRPFKMPRGCRAPRNAAVASAMRPARPPVYRRVARGSTVRRSRVLAAWPSLVSPLMSPRVSKSYASRGLSRPPCCTPSPSIISRRSLRAPEEFLTEASGSEAFSWRWTRDDTAAQCRHRGERRVEERERQHHHEPRHHEAHARHEGAHPSRARVAEEHRELRRRRTGQEIREREPFEEPLCAEPVALLLDLRLHHAEDAGTAIAHRAEREERRRNLVHGMDLRRDDPGCAAPQQLTIL